MAIKEFITTVFWLANIGLYLMIYLVFGEVGLTVIFVFIYFPMIFYNYLIYGAIDFWKKFWNGKPKILLNIFQITFYSIFYIIFILFFEKLFYSRMEISMIVKILGGIFLTIFLFIQVRLPQCCLSLPTKEMEPVKSYSDTILAQAPDSTNKNKPSGAAGLSRRGRQGSPVRLGWARPPGS